MQEEEKKNVGTKPESKSEAKSQAKPEPKPEPSPEAIAKKLRDKDDLRTFGVALIAAVIVVAGYHITRQLVRVIVRSNNPPAAVRRGGCRRAPRSCGAEVAPRPSPGNGECRPCGCQCGPRRHGEFKHGGPGPRGEFKHGRPGPRGEFRRPPRRGPKPAPKPPVEQKSEVKKPAEAPKTEVKKPEAPKAAPEKK